MAARDLTCQRSVRYGNIKQITLSVERNHHMSKFYVTCGSLRLITTAADVDAVAIWAINQFLSKRTPLDEIDWSDPNTVYNNELMEPLSELAEELQISEIGFDRCEVGILTTSDVISEWVQLAVAINRIEKLIG